MTKLNIVSRWQRYDLALSHIYYANWPCAALDAEARMR